MFKRSLSAFIVTDKELTDRRGQACPAPITETVAPPPGGATPRVYKALSHQPLAVMQEGIHPIHILNHNTMYHTPRPLAEYLLPDTVCVRGDISPESHETARTSASPYRRSHFRTFSNDVAQPLA
jgi:hypothetical protein